MKVEEAEAELAATALPPMNLGAIPTPDIDDLASWLRQIGTEAEPPRLSREQIYKMAEKPSYRHCAHDFGEDGWIRGRRRGRWCLAAPVVGSNYCHHHQPDPLDHHPSRRMVCNPVMPHLEAAAVAWWFAVLGGSEAFETFAKEAR